MITVGLVPIDPGHPDAQRCLTAYVEELNRLFEAGFDPSRSISAAVEEMRPPSGLFLIARIQGEAVGCGALKFHGDGPAELKRMWVSDAVRGLGIGRQLLSELEVQAAAHGVRVLHLETNGTLVAAIGLYRSAGYTEVAPFNDDPYAHHWFEKQIR